MSRPILIVEDDSDLAEGLRYNLEREQFQTRITPNGEQALDAALDVRKPPALILPDLMLPGMSDTARASEADELRRSAASAIASGHARGATAQRLSGHSPLCRGSLRSTAKGRH